MLLHDLSVIFDSLPYLGGTKPSQVVVIDDDEDCIFVNSSNQSAVLQSHVPKRRRLPQPHRHLRRVDSPGEVFMLASSLETMPDVTHQSPQPYNASSCSTPPAAQRHTDVLTVLSHDVADSSAASARWAYLSFLWYNICGPWFECTKIPRPYFYFIEQVTASLV